MKIKVFVRKAINFVRFLGKSEVERLRARGVVIGENVDIYNCNIDYGHGYLVTIGNNVTITNSTILTHDASTKKFLGYTKVGSVTIGDNVFVGHGSIILPGIEIGDNVIVGAGSIVRESIPENSVVCGNPAHMICTTEQYISRNRERLENGICFEKYGEEKSQEARLEMRKVLKPGITGYDL